MLAGGFTLLGRGATEVQDSRLVQHLDHDGTALAYEDTGTGDPPFVFVHGWTCNHTHFAPQVEHFGRQHRTVAVDLRGHGGERRAGAGRTPSPALPTTWPGSASSSASRARSSSATAWAAPWSSTWPRAYPDLPRAVVMVDAAPIVGSSPSAEMAAEVAAALAGPDGAATRAAIIEGTTASLHRDPALQARIRQDMGAVPAHVANSAVASIGLWDGEAAARACAVPALHIGAEDPINDAAALRALNPVPPHRPDRRRGSLQPARGPRSGQRDDRALPRDQCVVTR